MDQTTYEKLIGAVLSLEPVQIIERKGFRITNVSWSDNLKAVWTIPVRQSTDADHDARGHYVAPHTLVRGTGPLVEQFAAECPDQDLAVFSDAGAPIAVAVATVKAFRDWRSAYGERLAAAVA